MNAGELRDEVAAIIREHIFGSDTPSDEANCCADLVMDKVQRHIDAAREQVAEQIAAAIEEYALPITLNDWLKTGFVQAARIAREHSEGDG